MRAFVQSLPQSVFLVMLAFPLLMAGVAAFAGLRARRRAALVKATPTSSIATAEDGYRELEGHAEAIDGRTLAAPLTGAACVWYRARLEELKRSSSSDRQASWHTLREAESSAPFLVRDGSGVCAVEPFGAEVTPTDRSVWQGKRREPEDRNPQRVPPTESATPALQIAAGGSYRYTEERIYAGDRFLVLGDFRRERPEPDAEEEEEAEEAEAQPAPEEGADAWDDSALGDRLRERAEQLTDAWIGRGASRKPFLFTTTPQDQHVALSEKGGAAALGVAAFPLAIAALLAWLRCG
jgi:hypothetical protein